MGRDRCSGKHEYCSHPIGGHSLPLVVTCSQLWSSGAIGGNLLASCSPPGGQLLPTAQCTRAQSVAHLASDNLSDRASRKRIKSARSSAADISGTP